MGRQCYYYAVRAHLARRESKWRRLEGEIFAYVKKRVERGAFPDVILLVAQAQLAQGRARIFKEDRAFIAKRYKGAENDPRG